VAFLSGTAAFLTPGHSWHADIKPENILRVYGEFKLADFGFAKFSDVDWAGQIPTSFIHGGTAAYGESPITYVYFRNHSPYLC
jgi:serine/threonine protein kinase